MIVQTLKQAIGMVATRVSQRDDKEYGMLRTARCISLVGLLWAVVTLSGCPTGTTPGLSVTPLALSFGAQETSKSLRIQNRGGGTLTWIVEVSDNAPWLTLEAAAGAKQAGMLEGESTTEVDVITVLINRNLLAESTSRNATLTITSNAGNQNVSVGVAESGPARLVLSPTALAYGSTETEMNVAISNGGFEALSWNLTIPNDTPWLKASKTSGSGLIAGSVDSVTFTVDRTGLPSNSYETTVTFSSNGGSGEVLVTLSVPPLVVSTDSIDFGNLFQNASRFVNISNPSDSVTGVRITTDIGDAPANWLTLADVITSVDARTTETIRLNASPAGLDPGNYLATVTIASSSLNFSHVVFVSMEVPGFTVSPSTIDFGEITATTTRDFSLSNLTGTSVNYNIAIPATAPWISLSSVSGTLDGSATIQLTADPELIGAGSHEAVITITFGNSATAPSQTLTVRMSRPEPARLEASPKSILFGTALLERRIALWNAGIGAVGWRIDGTSFPAWLSLVNAPGSSLVSSGIATGNVSGEQTDEIVLRVDRSQAPAGQFEFTHSFNVIASGDADNVVPITLSMSIARVPVFVLEADDVDDRGISTLAVPATTVSRSFIIRNEGTGPLNWAFGALPSWVATLEPSQGTLAPNVQQSVTLTVSRNGLVTPGVQAFFEITTNDPDNETVFLDVAVSVPPVITIISDEMSLGFSEDESVSAVSIANGGSPGSILNYQIVSNQEWLSVSPENGVSVGTASPIKDFQPHSVTVDRSQLDGAGASGRLIITAFTVENGMAIPNPLIAPLEIPVTVEASPLTIESALPRKRVPSLIRNLMLFRNIRSESIPIPNSRLNQVGDLFRISESEVPTELTETNQFLKRGHSGNVLILLDFSGSMASSAAKVVADGQLGDPDTLTEDALKSVYSQFIPDLIDELPAQYKIGLGFMNGQNDVALDSVNIVTMNDGNPSFTADKDVVKTRFAGLVVNDNGASNILSALESSATILRRLDTNDNLRPFDDVDMKAVIAITDGRDTSLERVTVTANFMSAEGVRLFMVGWGEKVNADTIIRLASASGGHYYSTPARNTGLQDPFGVPIRVPQVEGLSDWAVLDSSDPCDESIANDLASQLIFSYTTLSTESSVVIRADLSFDDPNDQNSICLPEQNEIATTLEYSQQDFSTISGDVRLGQISLQTDGVSNGEAVITARADYIPRNIRTMSFDLSLVTLENLTLNVVPVLQTAGGLISNWTLSNAGSIYTFTSPDSTPLRFSDFGELFTITVTGVTQAFDLRFEVTAPTFTASNFETKYFTHPDGITVGGSPFFASSFPSPYFDSRPAPLNLESAFIVAADTNTDIVEIDVINLGGSHVVPGAPVNIVTGEFLDYTPFNVGLFWEATIGASDNFLSFVQDTPTGGFVTAYDKPSTLFVNLNRALTPPGLRDGEIVINYESGSVNNTGVLDPINIRYTIDFPAFDIDAFDVITRQFVDLPGLFLNFEATPDSQDIQITNTGQSLLQWQVDPNSLPAWVVLSDFVGVAGPDESNVVTITIVRESLPLGNQFADIVFTADYVDPITLTVSAEGVPAVK